MGKYFVTLNEVSIFTGHVNILSSLCFSISKKRKQIPVALNIYKFEYKRKEQNVNYMHLGNSTIPIINQIKNQVILNFKVYKYNELSNEYSLTQRL